MYRQQNLMVKDKTPYKSRTITINSKTFHGGFRQELADTLSAALKIMKQRVDPHGIFVIKAHPINPTNIACLNESSWSGMGGFTWTGIYNRWKGRLKYFGCNTGWVCF